MLYFLIHQFKHVLGFQKYRLVETDPPYPNSKSNEFYWYQVQSQDCHQSHVYSYTKTITDLNCLI